MSRGDSRFRDWRIHIDYPSGCCDAEVVRNHVRETCSRSGLYGFRDEQFCHQHHPDWEAWLREARRIEAIAQAAVDAEARGAARKSEGG
jgi:hypothetical protein